MRVTKVLYLRRLVLPIPESERSLCGLVPYLNGPSDRERAPPSLSSLVRMMASEMAVLERWIGGGGEYFAAAEHISPWMTSNKSQLLRVLLDHGASTFSEGGWYDVQVLMINEISSSPQSALHQ